LVNEEEAGTDSLQEGDEGPHIGSGHLEISLIGWRWAEVKNQVAVMGFILLSGLAKLVFHRAHWLSSRVPESCLLIILGTVFGAFLFVVLPGSDECTLNADCVDDSHLVFPKFTPELFFYYLLPPIILEAAYCLHNKHFFDNIRAILWFAVVGTIVNFLLTGTLLVLIQEGGFMGLHYTSVNLTMVGNVSTTTTSTTLEDIEGVRVTPLSVIEIFLFASLISAVDPVAVLSIFAEIGVNPDLYFLVFGESLLNDGVAVVLYNMMSVFAEMEASNRVVTETHILLGCASFFTVAFGGLAIGLTFGLLTAVITKFTSGVRVLEPLALLGGSYLAYVVAELFHWSGIISLIGCGLIQAHYAFKNISGESLTTVNYFIKMLSSTSDCIIFLYLGMAFFESHDWNTGFVCWTLLLCLVVRFVTIFTLSAVVNLMRKNIHPIGWNEQFIMAYGGLRGAVGFSLVNMVNSQAVPAARMFLTTTLAVVMFTVFAQGGTIKFIVDYLHIDRSKNAKKSLCEEINSKLFEHIMTGIEVISGKHGQFYARNRFNHYDKKYLKKWFCVPNYEQHMQKVYEEISLSDHFLHLYGPSMMAKDTISLAGETPRPDMGPPPTELNGNANGAYVPDSKSKPAKEEVELTRTQSLPMKVSMGPVGIPSTAVLQNGLDNSHTQWSRSLSSGQKELFSRDERQSLKRALKSTDPIYKLHQVYNKNLINVDGSNISLQLRKRRESARHMRHALLADDPRRRNTASAGFEMRPGGTEPWRLPPENAIPGVSMARVLTDSDTEAMIQRVQPEERDEVNALLEKHKELRRKKSANSFRREGVTQRPQALNSSQQPPNGELPPIGLIEEKEENSTAL